MNEIVNMSRRDFLKTGALFGGGLVLGFSLGGQRAAAEEGSEPPFAPNAFIRIATDGTVTIIVNHSEMGQGVYTSLPMLIAEELEIDVSRVRVESAPVDPAYNHTEWGVQGTGGSTSVRSEWTRLSKAGAAARLMLVAAAAAAWNVDPSTCRAENGHVIHDKTKKKLPYAKLAGKAAVLDVPKDVPLKKQKDCKLLGKAVRRLDSPEKTNGSAVFGIDVKLPGMLTALVARSPVFGGKVKSVNTDKAREVPGVKGIEQVDSGVAVIAQNFWAAKLGRDALEIIWDKGPGTRIGTPSLRRQYAGLAATAGDVAGKKGDASNALAEAARRLTAEYEVPYLAHACMEPLNCVVDLRPESCEIWTGTQLQTFDRDGAARVAGLQPNQVKLHTTFLGGGFGRRANPKSDFVVEAVQVAKAAKMPVKVIWTREDDMKGGYYRPFWYDKISAGLDTKGNLLAWHHTIVGQSIIVGTPFEGGMVKDGIDETSVEGATDIPYAIPNLLVDLHSPSLGVPVLWWRSVGHSHTAFVVESFLDEVAHAAGKDPFEFRTRLLTDHPRHLGVLKLAAEKAGWGKSLPKSRGRGIAVHYSFGSYIAQVAEVSVDKEGRIRVHRVVCAADCGKIVNPGTIRAQMESAVAFGLSAALHGAITIKDGRVEQGNFDDYPILRFSEMPAVEVHIVEGKENPGGIGEPGVPPVAPAVANAVFAATGARIRSLPMTPDIVLREINRRITERQSERRRQA